MKKLLSTFLTLVALSFTAAQSVTLEHRYGSTTIKGVPERVVTVGLLEQDALLALGVAPVGTTEWFGEQPGALWPWARAKLDELGAPLPQVIGSGSGVNLEAVLAQQPDLILALYSGITAEEYEQLSQIAPTVAQPAGYVDWFVPWREATHIVGQAVGKAEEAEALVTEMDARFSEVQKAHPEFVGATSVVASAYQGVWVFGAQDLRGQLMIDLGFRLPEGLDAFTEGSFGGNLSMERIDLLDVDALLWYNADLEQEPLANTLYQNLGVHQEAREVFIDGDTPLGAATSFVTALSIPYLLDGLVPQLAAAVDGDPATEVPASETAESANR